MLLIAWPFHLLAQQFSTEQQLIVDSLFQTVLYKTSQDTTIVNSLLALTSFYYQANKDSAMSFCERAEKISKRSKFHAGLVNSYNWLGYLLNTMGKSSEAIEYHQRSLKLSESANDLMGVGYSLNRIGSIYASQGNNGKGMEYFLKSLKLRQKIGDKAGIATCLNNIGFLFEQQGDVKQSLSYFHKSLKIEEEIGNEEGAATSLTNIGNIYVSQGDSEKGMEYFKKSLLLHKKTGLQGIRGVAINLNNIGAIYDKQQRNQLALEYYHKSLKIQKEISDKVGIAASLNNIGTIYSKLEDVPRALEYYYKSLDIKQEIGDKEGVTTSYNNMGALYYLENNMDKAGTLCEQSLKLAEELGYPVLIAKASGMLYKIDQKKGRFKEALAMYELFIQMKDSINNGNTQKAAIKQNMQYEYEKQHLADSLETAKELALKDVEISKQQAEAKAERTNKYGLFGGLALVLVIALVLFRSVNQKKKANEEITLQKLEVEHKNKEILDSITYAERIQSAILPPMNLMNEKLVDGFVLYKPKDIIAGDFYWLETVGDDVYFSAADCTGHGVPGAMMGVMCSNALTKSVKELGLAKPGEILDATTKIIESRFERSEQMVLDGMDLALCKLNIKTMRLEYAGANNSLWIIRDNEVLETKADKQPIGMYDDRKPYTNHEISLQKGDSFYIFSDGFVDQFGGPKGKKFKSKPFKNLLLSIQDASMDKQKELIDNALITWQGDIEQVDDICVIGIRV